MQYMLMVYEGEESFAAREGEDGAAYWAAWKAYGDALQQAGVVAGGAALQPPLAATTVRTREERRQVQDGPFAAAKEQLGGFFLIEVGDLDAALDWAGRCPVADDGGVEVRPVVPMVR